MSTSSKYTPGPWTIAHVANRSKWPRVTIGGQRSVCSIDIISEEDTANSKLVAAAPDMFEVIKELYAWAIDSGIKGPIFPKLEAAYKKATV